MIYPEFAMRWFSYVLDTAPPRFLFPQTLPQNKDEGQDE